MPDTSAHTYTAGADEPDGAVDDAYLSCLIRQEHSRDLHLVQRLGAAAGPAMADPVTLEMDCELYTAITPGDELTIRVHSRQIRPDELELTFEHLRSHPTGGDELVARGGQRIAYARPEAGATLGTPPATLAPARERRLLPHDGAPAGRRS